MYYNNDVIRYFQANKILALKLDHALTAVKEQIVNQVDVLGAGATRALYYTSCFTDEYQSVCENLKVEDARFRHGVFYLIQHGGVVYDMLKIYFEEIFKYKTSAQIERIKKMLMAVNIHIAASYLTSAGFSLAVATAVSMGTNLNIKISALAGRSASTLAGVMTAYGIVQKASESAHRLCVTYPGYYTALYAQELEMMYFLIEPLFEHAGALRVHRASDSEIADIITRMIK